MSKLCFRRGYDREKLLSIQKDLLNEFGKMHWAVRSESRVEVANLVTLAMQLAYHGGGDPLKGIEDGVHGFLAGELGEENLRCKVLLQEVTGLSNDASADGAQIAREP
jgi:hypothetical protein